MAEPTKTQDPQPPAGTDDKPEVAAGPKRNRDGLIPGQRVSPKELAAVRLKNRKKK